MTNRLHRMRAVAWVGALAVILTGCAPEAPAPSPSPSAPVSESPTAPAEPTESAEPTTPPVPTEFLVDGSAEDNALVLEGILQALADEARERPNGRLVADAAARAGFDRAAMELTADVTPLGLATDALTLAVRIQDECIVAELRGTDVTTIVIPVLSTGRCLVGATVSLD